MRSHRGWTEDDEHGGKALAPTTEVLEGSGGGEGDNSGVSRGGAQIQAG